MSILSGGVSAQQDGAKPHARFDGGIMYRPVHVIDNGVNEVKATVGYSIERNAVIFNWAWTANGPRPDQYSVQLENVTFWPTCVVAAGSGRVLVAGKRRTGNTVIELWEIGKPAVYRGWTNPAGEWEYPPMRIDITARRTVIDENTLDRGIVSTLFWNPYTAVGSAVSLYALFDDSRDFCEITLLASGTTSINRILSTTGAPGVQQVSALNCYRDSDWSANHAQHGYVFIMSSEPNDGGTCDVLALLDRDRNGHIDTDGVLTLDQAAWSASGLGTDNFLEYY